MRSIEAEINSLNDYYNRPRPATLVEYDPRDAAAAATLDIVRLGHGRGRGDFQPLLPDRSGFELGARPEASSALVGPTSTPGIVWPVGYPRSWRALRRHQHRRRWAVCGQSATIAAWGLRGTADFVVGRSGPPVASAGGARRVRATPWPTRPTAWEKRTLHCAMQIAAEHGRLGAVEEALAALERAGAIP
jgi:hypothetical protein